MQAREEEKKVINSQPFPAKLIKAVSSDTLSMVSWARDGHHHYYAAFTQNMSRRNAVKVAVE